MKESYGGRIVKLVLFGSRARGEGDENSDIDILVLVENEEQKIRRVLFDRAGDIFLEREVNISPLVMNRERYLWLKSIERGIVMDIEREGIEL